MKGWQASTVKTKTVIFQHMSKDTKHMSVKCRQVAWLVGKSRSVKTKSRRTVVDNTRPTMRFFLKGRWKWLHWNIFAGPFSTCCFALYEVILIRRLGEIRHAAFPQKLQDVRVQVLALEISQPPAPPVNQFDSAQWYVLTRLFGKTSFRGDTVESVMVRVAFK